MKCRLVLFGAVLVLGLSVCASSATGAAPIYLDPSKTRYYDFEFAVVSSVTLVPGQTGFIQAALRNTGTEPVTFQSWDGSRSRSGWDHNAPGLTLGHGGYGLIGWLSIAVAKGRVDPVPFERSGGPSNYSHLSNVTINPGETLVFDLVSVRLFPTHRDDLLVVPGAPLGGTPVVPGETGVYQTYTQIGFGSTTWQSAWYAVHITAGTSFESGPLEEVALSNPPALVTPAPPVQLRRGP